MKKRLFTALTGLFVPFFVAGSVVTSGAEVSALSKADSMAQWQSAFDKASELTLSHAHLAFAGYYNNEVKGGDAEQEMRLWKLIFQVAELKKDKNSVCENIAADELQNTLEVASSRQLLLDGLSRSRPQYKGSFSELHQGELWYQHWLRTWLQDDVSYEQLESIAMGELEDAALRRAKLASSALPTNLTEIAGTDTKAIVAAYRQRERLVYQNISQVLGFDFRVEDVNIVKSDFPKSFPAPGIYNPDTRSFIYHLHGDTLPVKQMDWLFLHEAVPGHHLFSLIPESQLKCPQFTGLPGATVFTEGWAAYMENLGQELGLYQDRSSIEYALDWQELRAVRVLLDIGIHAKGWSDEQAIALWMEHIPEQKGIMLREINRIRRWPVQVSTYVYGKAMIKNKIAQLKSDDPDKTLADIHRDILSHANFSIRALKFIQ